MRTYHVYIDNHKQGIDHRCFYLGNIQARNKRQAVSQAERKYNAEVFGFSSVYGAESTVFVMKA